MNFKSLSLLIALGGMMISCSSGEKTGNSANTPEENYVIKSGLNTENLKTVINGKEVELYTLTNSNGMEACITNYGGRVVSLMVPDKEGNFRDVVLGHDSIGDYINIDGNFGALIGRYGNRINQGQFSIDSVTYKLPQNDHGHCLHGGPKGFHHKVWTVEEVTDSTLHLSLVSPDRDAGFPGNVKVDVVYTLTDDNALDIAYLATTDKPTVLNLTNHSYFNLSGDPSKDVMNDTVWFDANGYTPIDSSFMTNGEILAVDETPFDFRKPTTVGKRINMGNSQLKNGKGYDHNMVLRRGRDKKEPAAYISNPESGIKMEVITPEPGIQFYTGNFLDGTVKGKNGIAYPRRAAICLETQHYPDSPNKPQWPSVVVRPGEKYTSQCTYRFSVVK